MKEYARIAVRPNSREKSLEHDGCLILGLTHPDIFKPGHVYEITKVLDEFIVKDLGPGSADAEPPIETGVTWSRDANALIRDGRHLFTQAEARYRAYRNTECANCSHLGREHMLDGTCLFGAGLFQPTDVHTDQEEEDT